MIRPSLDGADSVRAKLAAIPDEAETALLRAAQDLADDIRAVADRNLSGGVLQSRTGALRDSLASMATGSGAGIGATVTASTPYAAFQEFGFSGTESVREFFRRQTMVFGRAVLPIEVKVRTHDRRVDYPGRSYLRAALAEVAPSIRGALLDAVAEVLRS